MFSGTKSRVMADIDHAQSQKSGMGGPLAIMFGKDENVGSMDFSYREIGDDGNYYECVICDNGGDLLCCDSCPGAFHLQCLNPPIQHVPAGSWQCQRCCEIYDLIGPLKCRLSSSPTPDSSYSSLEQPTGGELDAAEVLANRMSCSYSYDKNLPNEDLVTDLDQSLRWKGNFLKRSGLKRCRLFNSSSTQIESDKQVDGDLKKAAPCLDMKEAKATQKQTRVVAPQLVDSDGLLDVPQPLENVQYAVSRHNGLVDIWFEDELDALWIGVRWYGPGNWQMMLEDPFLKLSKFKTPEDLSLRWEMERQKIPHIENDQAPFNHLEGPPRRLLHSAVSAPTSSRVARTRDILKDCNPPGPSTSSEKKRSRCGKLRVPRALLDDESQSAMTKSGHKNKRRNPSSSEVARTRDIPNDRGSSGPSTFSKKKLSRCGKLEVTRELPARQSAHETLAGAGSSLKDWHAEAGASSEETVSE